MPRLLELTVGGSPAPWLSLGLIDSSASPRIADVGISFGTAHTGLVSWSVSSPDRGGLSGSTLVDGITTTCRDGSHDTAALRDESPFGGGNAVAIDHIVVNTDNLERTSEALSESLGTELRRVRDAGRGVVQGFHVLDNTVIEIVSGPHVTEPGAKLWGFVVVVDDIDAVVAQLGNFATPVKAAVQPGRCISSLRAEAGLGVPLAVMSPRI